MRKKHELDRGIVCERCRCIATKMQYKRITVTVPVIEDTTGRTRNLNRVNLCNKCYKEYENPMKNFLF